jgi:hypothetical protein
MYIFTSQNFDEGGYLNKLMIVIPLAADSEGKFMFC